MLENSINSICASIQSPNPCVSERFKAKRCGERANVSQTTAAAMPEGLVLPYPRKAAFWLYFFYIYSFLILEGFSQGLQRGWGSPCAGAQDRTRQKKAVPIARCPGSQCGCFLQDNDNFFC